MIRQQRLIVIVASAFVGLGVGEESLFAIPQDQEAQVAELRRIGGTVFQRLFGMKRAERPPTTDAA